MRRTVMLAVLVVTATASTSFAQSQTTGATSEAANATSVQRDGGQLNIASGTRLAAQLQSTLDVSSARVGDQVVLKTTEAIKSGRETVVKKGARLVGHVSDVKKKAKGSADSSLTLIFDRLESGSLSAPISVTINSITQTATRARVDDAGLMSDSRTQSSTSTSAKSGPSGGGVLGGVTGAVGNTVGAVAGTAGEVVGGTTETVGGVAKGATSTLGKVQVTQSASASAEGGSTLSLTGGNLRLEKGTTFNLTINESATVGNNQ